MFRALVASLSLLACLDLVACAQQQPTVAQTIDRLRHAAGVTPFSGTVDTVKIGDPEARVTGIASTIAPTMNVLRQAVASHDNLIITHEPTFYNHLDTDALFKGDPIYAEKRAYIQAHHLTVFRWHDGWHQRRPDGILEGWTEQMGWSSFQNKSNQYLFAIPPTTLSMLAQQIQIKTGRITRVVGDPKLPVTHVAVAPGASGEQSHIPLLQRKDVEVLILGEVPEWETISYVLDASQLHRQKGMILLGHYSSEEAGMENFAKWLRTVLPGTRVDFISAGEPYWLPGQPPNRR